VSNSVVSWIGWHVGELAGVIVPGVVALTVTPWAAVLSVVVAVSWTVHEVRLARLVPPALAPSRSEEDTPVAGWGGA
jgi:hypothetical protein